jgi:predicted MFS family arabinose efflux permease
MAATTVRPAPAPAATVPKLPLPALLVRACTTFIVIMTRTMPGGLLPQIAGGIGVSEGAAGQLVSA